MVPLQWEGLLFSPAAGLPDSPHPTPLVTAPSLSPVSGAILCKPMTPPILRAAHMILSSTPPALSSVSVTWWKQLERPLETSHCWYLFFLKVWKMTPNSPRMWARGGGQD